MELTKGSTPMKPVARVLDGAVEQMLAAAEADLQADLADRRGRTARTGVGRRSGVEIELQGRQQPFEMLGLRRRAGSCPCAGRRRPCRSPAPLPSSSNCPLQIDCRAGAVRQPSGRLALA